jgi:hypothetical protein
MENENDSNKEDTFNKTEFNSFVKDALAQIKKINDSYKKLFEAEEGKILEATRKRPLSLTVEESGCLEELCELVKSKKEKGNFIPNANAVNEFYNLEGNTTTEDCGCDEKKENNTLRNVAFGVVVIGLIYYLYKKG